MIVPICPLNDDNIDFLTGIISYLDYTHFPFPFPFLSFLCMLLPCEANGDIEFDKKRDNFSEKLLLL